MKSLPLEARTRNRTHNDFCRWCGDDGIVVAQTRLELAGAWAMERGIKPAEGSCYEEMAPCPYCEVGFKIEFQEGGAWMPDGFWQGRDTGELFPVCPEGRPHALPLTEGRRLARELAQGVLGHFGEVVT